MEILQENTFEELELYFHIPFCVRKCEYCDFLSAPATQQVQNVYMEAVLKEIAYRSDKTRTVTSVFVGGGTPSVVQPVWIERLFQTVQKYFILDGSAEISMEINPGTVTKESLLRYHKAGVNRLSIGCQSADDEELKRLGRIHTFGQFMETYAQAREVGFRNINVDLMSALPGQRAEAFYCSLQKVLGLNPPPEHISVYSLMVEEGTPFYEKWEKGLLPMPDEEEERKIYWETDRILEQAGYRHYEISNYARPDRECRHNCGYWLRREYLGFGIGAASLYRNRRFRNTDSIEEYLAIFGNPQERLGQTEDLERQISQILSARECMEETMFLGLRMLGGLEIADFERQFGVPMETVYGDVIRKGILDGLLEIRGDRLALTHRGIDLSNYIMAKFLLED